MPPAVHLEGVSKRYRIYRRQRDRLKEALTLGRVKRGHDFWALQDIDLKVERGTTLGILGRNGAGKSTLLQVISGVLQPTGGTVRVEGQIVFLQLGAGFNPKFTGRENVMLNGLILGIEREKVLERFEEIEAFADIGEFMDQPVKTYSSGMRARLGFAVAINVEPDILIVDETLSVGDAVFRHMGLQKMRELRDRGTTILFVSHSVGMVKNFCTEAALLHKGRLLAHGDTSETLDRYQALISRSQAQQRFDLPNPDQAPNYNIDEDGGSLSPSFKENPELDRRVSGFRHGTGEARISNVELLDRTGSPVNMVNPDSTLTVRVHLEYMEAVNNSALNITLRNKSGLDVFSTSTALENARLGKRAAGERVIVDFTLPVPLQHGPYSVTAALNYPHNRNLYMDWLDVAAAFNISRPSDRSNIPGLVHIPTKVEIHSPDREQNTDRSA